MDLYLFQAEIRKYTRHIPIASLEFQIFFPNHYHMKVSSVNVHASHRKIFEVSPHTFLHCHCLRVNSVDIVYLHLMSSLGAYCCCTTLHNISQQSRTKP